MIVSLPDILSVLFYILLIALVVVLIILVINAIKTLDKVNNLVDDLSQKSSQLDGLFSIIDNTTDAVVGLSDSVVTFAARMVSKLLKGKKEKKHDKE